MIFPNTGDLNKVGQRRLINAIYRDAVTLQGARLLINLIWRVIQTFVATQFRQEDDTSIVDRERRTILELSSVPQAINPVVDMMSKIFICTLLVLTEK